MTTPTPSECPQCGGQQTKARFVDTQEAETGYRNHGWITECVDCGERF